MVYSKMDHAIKQTIEKTINFYLCVEQDINQKIEKWLNEDDGTALMLMDLIVLFSENGWAPPDSLANYETVETNKLSKEIYERSMAYFKGVK